MKKFVMGFIFGLMLSIAFTAHAQVTTLIGKVIDSSYSVTVNGQKIEKEAIAIEGTSYLPVRIMAEIVEMDVKFDSKTGIELTDKQGADVQMDATNETSMGSTNTSIDEPSVEYKIGVLDRRILEIEELILVNESFRNDLDDETKKAKIQETINELELKLSELRIEKSELEAQLTTPN